MKEIRKDIINDNIVIFAKDRFDRPKDTSNKPSGDLSTGDYDKNCPFCRGNEKSTGKALYKIECNKKWITKSVYNKFPILDRDSCDIYGVHEVIVDTHRHNGSFFDMSLDEFENLLEMYLNRYKNLISDDNVKQVVIFKNFLKGSGASLMHPHSQIISLSVVPPEIENEIEVSREYYINNGKNLYEDLINEEIEINKRVIYNGDKYLVVVPEVTIYTGEVRIIFKENIRFEDIEQSYIDELSKIMKKLFSNMNKSDGINPFNIMIHTHPKNMVDTSYFNVHIHIIPRRYSFGGFELATGLYVSSIEGEQICNKLKFDTIE